MKFDVIVIGSGVGGCVSSALLAHRGFNVLLLEKNDRVGGSLASYEKNGYKLGIGSHLFSRGEKGPLGRVLRNLGINDVKFITLPEPAISRGIFDIALPSSRLKLPLFFVEVIKKLKVPAKEVFRTMKMFLDIFMMRESDLKKWDGKNLEDFIFTYTHYPPVYYFLSFLLGIYFVLPPWEISAGEGIYCFKNMFMDYCLSSTNGGASKIPLSLVHYLQKKNGTLILNARVQKIEKKNALWKVITSDGKEFSSSAVISTLCLSDTLNMVGKEKFPHHFSDKISKIKGSLNAFQVKAVFKKPLLKSGCLIGGVSLDGKELGDLTIPMLHSLTNKTIKGKVPDPLAIYAPIPTNYDSSLTKNGEQILTACIYGPTHPDLQDPLDKWKERILQALSSIIPGFFEELIFFDFFDIETMGRWMGKKGNTAISTGQTPGQVGNERPSVRLPVNGLFACGDCAGGRGIGTELATQSAIECVDAIISDFKYRKL